MTELNVRLSIDVTEHSKRECSLGPRILVICSIKTRTIKVSAIDKLTKIMLDVTRRSVENLQNALMTRTLPEMVPTAIKMAYTQTKKTFILYLSFPSTSERSVEVALLEDLEPFISKAFMVPDKFENVPLTVLSVFECQRLEIVPEILHSFLFSPCRCFL